MSTRTKLWRRAACSTTSEADVGVQPLLAHAVEHLVVELCAVPGLAGVAYILAQVVDAHAQAELVDGTRRSQRVVDGSAGYKSPGEPLPGPGLFSSRTEGLAFRKRNERGP